MFYRIRENKLYDYAQAKYADDCLETNIITQDELDKDRNRVIVENGVLILNPNYANDLEQGFNKQFITTSQGCIRINTAWGNFLTIKPNYDFQVQTLGYLPANTIIFYTKPNFSDFQTKEAMEEWLVANSFKNAQISASDYMTFSNEILAYYQGLIEVQ